MNSLERLCPKCVIILIPEMEATIDGKKVERIYNCSECKNHYTEGYLTAYEEIKKHG